MQRLTEEQIEAAIEQAKGWKREGKLIQKRYKFQTFLQGIHFVNRIAELSEEVKHHPFISVDYRNVTLKLTSWHAGGLTDLDFELSAKYNSIYEKISEETLEVE